MSIEIEFLGAARGVTGSQFLVTARNRRVLIDCGMFQGSPDEIARNRRPFAFEPRELDAALLTHAHLDHCGRLPSLVKAGFRGGIHATGATVDLAEIVLRDSARLQSEFVSRWRRHHPDEVDDDDDAEGLEGDDPALEDRRREAARSGRTETREALYDEADVVQTLRQTKPAEYGERVEVADGISVVLHDAGHILGAAIIELRIREGGRTLTVVFSGDLGRCDTPIIRDPASLAHADYVVVSSTYGDREHGPREQLIDDLATAVQEVIDNHGALVVPAFAIGRTQELIWLLDHLVREGRVPRVPIFLDSPMASRATQVYYDHPEIFDDETRELVMSGDSPLEYAGLEFTETVAESKAIRRAERPFIVVASSGMLTGGRIMHHLKDFLPDPASTLLFIGYQGEGTLGRHLQSGGRTARIDEQEYEVGCRVQSISGFSAHADRHELDAWLGHFGSARDPGAHDAGDRRPKGVFVVHGDPESAEAFAQRIKDDLRLEARVPRRGERVTLGT
jgi:metallo-beta-lactamase family protein